MQRFVRSSTMLAVAVAFLASADTRMLCVGNSFTFFGGSDAWPHLLARIAESDSAKPFVVRLVGESSIGLKAQLSRTDALDLIAQGGWDYVSLQDYKDAISNDPNEGVWIDAVGAVRDAGGEPIVYFHPRGLMNDPGELSVQVILTTRLPTYYRMLPKLDCPDLAPAGIACQLARKQLPSLNLYDSDEYHPGLAGRYLIACTFYATLFDKSPEGLWAPSGLSQSNAAALQRIAWESLEEWETQTKDIFLFPPSKPCGSGDVVAIRTAFPRGGATGRSVSVPPAGSVTVLGQRAARSLGAGKAVLITPWGDRVLVHEP